MDWNSTIASTEQNPAILNEYGTFFIVLTELH